MREGSGPERPGPDYPPEWDQEPDDQEALMSNPGAKQFQQVRITVDVWVDPETSDSSAWVVADNVEITARNAVEAAMKEIEAPDHGIEVVVR